jgi:hypothetical protein
MNMSTNTTEIGEQEVFSEVLWALDHARAVAVMWARGMQRGYLDKLPSFQAYCALANCGPRNDCNGVRNTAEKLKFRMELEILAQAQQLKATLA